MSGTASANIKGPSSSSSPGLAVEADLQSTFHTLDYGDTEDGTPDLVEEEGVAVMKIKGGR
jgi:hypothetical protein